MSELSREQVELIALSFADDGMSYEQRQAMQRLTDTDAALRAKLGAVEQEIQQWRSGGITEELLRKQDGHLRLGKGCVIVIESEWDHLQATKESCTVDRWTMEKPTEDGYYFYRNGKQPNPIMAHIINGHAHFEGGGLFTVATLAGEWQRPIEPKA